MKCAVRQHMEDNALSPLTCKALCPIKSTSRKPLDYMHLSYCGQVLNKSAGLNGGIFVRGIPPRYTFA